MHEPILVVGAGLKEERKMCAVLERHRYSATPLRSLDELASAVLKSPCRAVILDLDSLPVDNRFFRDLRKNTPGLCVIGISRITFHPELEEAMRTHVFACLSKPIDPDELVFWLKSICGNDPRSRASPG